MVLVSCGGRERRGKKSSLLCSASTHPSIFKIVCCLSFFLFYLFHFFLFLSYGRLSYFGFFPPRFWLRSSRCYIFLSLSEKCLEQLTINLTQCSNFCIWYPHFPRSVPFFSSFFYIFHPEVFVIYMSSLNELVEVLEYFECYFEIPRPVEKKLCTVVFLEIYFDKNCFGKCAFFASEPRYKFFRFAVQTKILSV